MKTPTAFATKTQAVGALGIEGRQSLRRLQRRKTLWAITLTLPLAIFLLFTFLIPLSVLLLRAVENPEVAESLPRTSKILQSWDRHADLPDSAYRALMDDLSQLPNPAIAGNLARKLNSELAGGRSLIMSTYRSLNELRETPQNPHEAQNAKETLLAINPAWAQIEFWHIIAKNSARWTPDYLLLSIDLKRDADRQIVAVEPSLAVFRDILWRTLEIGLIVTVITLILAYPLSYWLSTLSERAANLLLIVVLLPFWTSVLVRIAAWIVILQTSGLINRLLMFLHLIDAPLPLLFNRTGVVIAMVHIMLPFMVLPLYSVMKTVPPNYLRAAISLGSPPLFAFFRIYVPQTYSGIAAGSLLVFITALGYYVTPALLGGAGDQMLSYYVAQYTNVEVNWGMASALGSVLLLATLILFTFYRRYARLDLAVN